MRKSTLSILLIAILLSACRSGAGIEPEILLTATVVPSPQVTPTTSAEERALLLFKDGKSMLEDDQCQVAVEYLEEAVSLNPAMAEAFLVLGNGYTRIGKSELAVKAYKSALEIDKDYSAAYTNLGAAYLRDAASPDGFRDAIDAFETALDLEPDDAETYSNLGSAYLQASQMPQSKDAFDRAVELDPELAEAHVGVGYLYLLTGQSTEALVHLEKAILLDPNMPEAMFAMGIAYAEANQLDKAIEQLEDFLKVEISPECPGDIAAAEEARNQAEIILEQLRDQ